MATGIRSPRTLLLDSQLSVLYLSLFVVMIGYGGTFIVLPYHAKSITGLAGAPPAALALQVGMLTSIYALAQLLGAPLAGRLADHVGCRIVLIGGLGGLATTQIATGLSTTLAALYVLRFLGGLAAAGLMVAASAYVADRTTAQNRTRGMALFGTSISLGLVAGPAMAGLLSRPGVDIGSGRFRVDGYSLPFLFSGLLTLAVLGYANARLRRAGRAPRPATLRHGTPSAPDRATRLTLRVLLSLVAVSQYGLAVFEGTFVLYARDRLSFSSAQTSVAFIVCGVVMAALQLPATGVLARAAPPLVQVGGGFALMGAGISGLLAVTSYPVVLGLIGVLAAGAALVVPNLSALVANSAGANTGLALGWKSSASSLGQFLGPLVGGSLIGWRAGVPFLMAGSMLLVVSAATIGAHLLSAAAR